MEHYDEKIIQYLEEGLTSEEQEAFDQYLEQSTEFQKEVDDYSFIYKTASELKLHKQVNTNRNWEEVSRKIKRQKTKSNIFRISRYAAAFLCIPIFILFGVYYGKYTDLEKLTAQEFEMVVPNGMYSKVVLSDGSEVWLNAGSKLSYPQRFSSNQRTVRLQGEGYFKVESEKSNPFEVILSNNISVSAYGTEFNISAYEGDDLVEITLVKGKVEVNTSENLENHILNPGESLLYHIKEEKASVLQTNLSANTSWKDGIMVFRRTNMTDVARRLSRHFNADVVLEDPQLYTYEYTATFTTETLSEILQLLVKTAPIEYEAIDPPKTDSLSRRKVILKMKK